MLLLNLLLALLSVQDVDVRPLLPPPFGMNCFDGEIDTVIADTARVRRRPATVDSFVYPSYVRLGQTVRIGERDLPCLYESRLVGSDDSILRFELRRRLLPRGFPKFSLGAGMTLQASASTSGFLVGAMNRAVDSSGATVMLAQAALDMEVLLLGAIGYRHGMGLGGSCYISRKEGKDDPISLPYEESSHTLFLEAMPSRYFPSFPAVGFRYGYSWLYGKLGVTPDALRRELLDYQGHARVHVETGGHAQEFALVMGENLHVDLVLHRKQIERGSAVLLKSWNLGLTFGARL